MIGDIIGLFFATILWIIFGLIATNLFKSCTILGRVRKQKVNKIFCILLGPISFAIMAFVMICEVLSYAISDILK